MASQEFRMQEVNEQADKLVNEGHPEKETIVKRKEVTLYSFFFPILVLPLIEVILIIMNLG